MSTTSEIVERLTEWANGCEREAAGVSSVDGLVARKEAVQLRAAAARLSELEAENARLRECAEALETVRGCGVLPISVGRIVDTALQALAEGGAS